MKRIFILTLCLISLCTGCQGAMEIDDQAFVLNMSLDAGTEKALQISFEMPSPVVARAEQSAGNNYTVVSIHADSILEAMTLTNATIPRRVNLSHLETIFISEALAQKGVESLLISLLDYSQTIKGCQLIIAKGSALECMDNLANLHTNLTKLYDEFVKETGMSGVVPNSTMLSFIEGMWGDSGDPVIPYAAVNPAGGTPVSQYESESQGEPKAQKQADSQNATDPPWQMAMQPESFLAGEVSRVGGLGTDVLGCAIFRQGSMAAALDGLDTRLLLMARGEYKTGQYVLDIGDEDALALSVKSGRQPEITIACSEIPVIHMRVFLSVDAHSGRAKELEAYLKQYFESGIQALADECIRLQSDAMAWGKTAVRQFDTPEAWEGYAFSQKLQHAQVSVTVEVAVSSVSGGLYYDTPQQKRE